MPTCYAEVTDGVTTTFALDVAGGLPEVIYTSDNEVFLHLPGVIVAESATGETRYLLSDGLGSIRHAVDENAQVVVYNEFDPYGNPVQNSSDVYGYTGEWWQDDIELLHLRARWYAPETGTFLSVDPWEGDTLRPYTLVGHSYVYGNPINSRDPSGLAPPISCSDPTQSCYDSLPFLESLASPPGPLPSPNPPPLAPPIPTPANQCNLNYYQFTAGGFAEGVAWSYSRLTEVKQMGGREIVFNFATMERGLFSFEEDQLIDPGITDEVAGVSTTLFGLDGIEYNLQLSGFDSRKSLREQYEDRSLGATAGANFGVGVSGGFGTIATFPPFDSTSSGVNGFGQYKSLSLGISAPLVSGSLVAATYEPHNWHNNHWQYVSGSGYVTINEIRQMKDDIKSGWYSPWTSIQLGEEIHHDELGPWSARDKAVENLQKVWETHQYYFENRFKDDQPLRGQ